MSIYRYIDYREAIKYFLEIKRKLPGKLTLAALAKDSGLQPSYLTNVLKGRFEFSADQLFALSTELGCSEAERDFMLLLLEHSRSTHKRRRELLRAQIETVRKQNQKTEKQLSVRVVEPSTDLQFQAYLDPFAQLVLIHLKLPPYNTQPEKLCFALGISQPHLRQVLDLLLKLGHVRLEGATYNVMTLNKHLPKSSPLSGPHLALMRLKSLDQLQRLSPEQSYTHSVTFTATDEVMQELSDAYFQFLKKAEAIVKPAPSEKAFQMNFDLFPWRL